MDDHDGGHDQRDDVREVSRALENDCVGKLDGTRVALSRNARVAGDAGWRPDERAQRECRLLTHGHEVAEAHLDCS